MSSCASPILWLLREPVAPVEISAISPCQQSRLAGAGHIVGCLARRFHPIGTTSKWFIATDTAFLGLQAALVCLLVPRLVLLEQRMHLH